MGEVNTSDCSWKKMVISKENNKWTSKIPLHEDSESAGSTSSFSMSDDNNIKKEYVEQSNILHLSDFGNGIDPLLIESGSETPDGRRSSNGKCESSEQRALRLAKMSAYSAKRLSRESPEQRALRLRRMSEYAARRLAHESSDQRAKRLARMSAYAAQRIANESPEQRKERLARMSAYAARRHALKKLGSSGSAVELADPKSFLKIQYDQEQEEANKP